MPTPKVLVITPDRLGPSMAGPAIRAAAIADAVSKQNETVLLSLNDTVLANKEGISFVLLLLACCSNKYLKGTAIFSLFCPNKRTTKNKKKQL